MNTIDPNPLFAQDAQSNTHNFPATKKGVLSLHAFAMERSKPKVLVLDDDYAIAETLRVILSLHGFDAVAVCDGRAAIESAKAWKPDILVSDVFMPIMDGFDTAAEIYAILPNCRVLLLSSEPRALRTVRQYRKLGFRFEFLLKPFHPSQLLNQLRRV